MSGSLDRQLGQHIASTVSVKNTFIDGFANDGDEGAEDGLPMVAVKSCPAGRILVSGQSTSPADIKSGDLDSESESAAEGTPSRSFLVRYLPCNRGGPAPDTHAAELVARKLTTPNCGAMPARHDEQQPTLLSHLSSHAVAVAGVAGATSQLGVATAGGASSASVAARLAARRPETSAGSLLHDAGQCKPCAWFWRPHGCQNGAECRHCHLCEAGAIKARRKAKVTLLRDQDNGEHCSPHDKKLM